MSIEISSHVWKYSRQSGTKLLLLVALADYTNAEGVAWPSIKSLCQRTRMSERYVQNMLRDLEEAGEIEIMRREGSSNVFRIICAPVLPGAPQGCTPVHPTPALGITPGVMRAAPRTIIESSKEPLFIPNRKKQKGSEFQRTPSRPSVEEVLKYGETLLLEDAESRRFFDYYEGIGWAIRDTPIRDWKAKMRGWLTQLEMKAMSTPEKKPAECSLR